MNKCLVTGATGFIGHVLCQYLRQRGMWVLGTARHEANGSWNKFVVSKLGGESFDPAILTGIDTIFHVAGKAHEISASTVDEAAYRQLNVDGTRTLLLAAEQRNVGRFVFFSSVKAMGEGNNRRINEDWPVAPETSYGRTKLQAEQAVLEMGLQSGMHVCNLRLPLVYGPGVKGNLLRMMEAIDRRRLPPLPETGNKRSMVHVDDAVRAALLAAEYPRANGQVYIVTDRHAYSARRMYDLICRGLGKQPSRWSVPRGLLRVGARVGDTIGSVSGRRFLFDSNALTKLLGSAWYSSEKITRELGYEPTHTLDDSVKEMVEVYRKTPRTRGHG